MSDKRWQPAPRLGDRGQRRWEFFHQTSYVVLQTFRLDFLASHSAVRLEDARRGKLAELVADHVLRDVHGDERLAVMHAERVADEIGRNRRAPGPGLDGLLGAGLDRLLDFPGQLVMAEE